MAKVQEYYWKSKHQLDIRTLHWEIANPKAVIAHVHGQGEHAGRYGHVADFFNKNGYAMLALDQQGHGKSGGNRGHIKDLDDHLDNISLFLDEVRAKYPKLPIFLHGHSMGGLVVLHYTLQTKPNIQGLIATSPWIRLAFEPNPIKVFVGKMLRSLVPKLAMPSGLASEHVSRNQECVNAYKTDPLVHRMVSASGGMALMEGGEWLDAYSGPISVPTYIIHGADDKVTSQPASEAFANRLSGDVTYKKYDGLYHETHNEPEQLEVLTDTLAWINKKLS